MFTTDQLQALARYFLGVICAANDTVHRQLDVTLDAVNVTQVPNAPAWTAALPPAVDYDAATNDLDRAVGALHRYAVNSASNPAFILADYSTDALTCDKPEAYEDIATHGWTLTQLALYPALYGVPGQGDTPALPALAAYVPTDYFNLTHGSVI